MNGMKYFKKSVYMAISYHWSLSVFEADCYSWNAFCITYREGWNIRESKGLECFDQ